MATGARGEVGQRVRRLVTVMVFAWDPGNVTTPLRSVMERNAMETLPTQNHVTGTCLVVSWNTMLPSSGTCLQTFLCSGQVEVWNWCSEFYVNTASIWQYTLFPVLFFSRGLPRKWSWSILRICLCGSSCEFDLPSLNSSLFNFQHRQLPPTLFNCLIETTAANPLL